MSKLFCTLNFKKQAFCALTNALCFVNLEIIILIKILLSIIFLIKSILWNQKNQKSELRSSGIILQINVCKRPMTNFWTNGTTEAHNSSKWRELSQDFKFYIYLLKLLYKSKKKLEKLEKKLKKTIAHNFFDHSRQILAHFSLVLKVINKFQR